MFSVRLGDEIFGFSSEGNIYLINKNDGFVVAIPASFSFLKNLDFTDMDYDPVKKLVVLMEKNGHRVIIDLDKKSIVGAKHIVKVTVFDDGKQLERGDFILQSDVKQGPECRKPILYRRL